LATSRMVTWRFPPLARGFNRVLLGRLFTSGVNEFRK
jgi:hypothetical protein